MIYTIDSKDEFAKLNPSEILEAMSGGNTTAMMMSTSASGSVFNEMIDDKPGLFIKEHIIIIAGTCAAGFLNVFVNKFLIALVICSTPIILI